MNEDIIRQALNSFSPQQQAVIQHHINAHNFNGVLPADLVTQLLQVPANLAELMLKFLPLARHYALPATSEFYVGAVVEGKSGALYLGANLEIAGDALANTIHAEQSAINNALLHGEKGVVRIAITHPPCGHCRQFINEIEDAAAIEIIVLDKPTLSLSDLLPEPFGPKELGSEKMLFSHTQNKQETSDAYINLQHSYAPHTQSPAIVRLEVLSEENKNTEVFGIYIENAAYNPSLSPLISALDRLRFYEQDFKKIKTVELIERKEARISQRQHILSLLKTIAPNADFIYKTQH